ncbi:hypothetical protein [Phenylobacterium sp. 58.2.17]|uniref:hypothetical protein n=1 Tax=Phenylobacterium sp. 58.2.17 TaxID=2969306 RepID=UPI002263DE44|nr:hypothetical protein [Phenylobacterium sp. 58.2.17]MCX7584901.1 hypothetical protein [Phenylobacterium sp. 58.2.17]
MLKLQTATSAVEFDYEELHDASEIAIELRTLESPINEWGDDALASCEGRVVGYRLGPFEALVELGVKLPVTLTLYRTWNSSVEDFARQPDSQNGRVAVTIGRFESSRYECLVAALDEDERLLQRLAVSMLAARASGEQVVEVVLRRSLEEMRAFDGARLEVGDGSLRPFIEDYADRDLGIEVYGDDGFLQGLDARESEPPTIYFESLEAGFAIRLPKPAKSGEGSAAVAKRRIPRTM